MIQTHCLFPFCYYYYLVAGVEGPAKPVGHKINNKWNSSQ